MLSSLLEGKPGAVRHFCARRMIVCAAAMAAGLAFTPQVAMAQEACFNDADCNDGNLCTDDQCACGFDCPPNAGVCFHISTCDDDLFCNGNEFCCQLPGGCGGIPFGVCQPGEDTVCPAGKFCSEALVGTCVGCEFDAQCADNNDCTTDSCNQSTHLCEFADVPSGPCNDGDACTLNDTCFPGGICEGVAMDCGIVAPVCNTGTCVNGDCQFTPIGSASCNDGDVCTATSTCQNGVCVGGDANGCVNLELRLPPGAPSPNVGDVVEVQLWAVSNGCPAPPPQSTCSTGSQDILSVQAIISYDPTVLALADPSVIGSPNPEDPCDDLDSCNTNCGSPTFYNWGSSLFPNTCGGGDPVNEPCTGIPAPDGDFFYASISQITCDGGSAESACVLSTGMHVTTFKFVAVGATVGVGSGSPVVLEQCSLKARTSVAAGAVSGLDVLGDRIDTSVEVGCTSGAQCPFGVCDEARCSPCPAPTVQVLGPRYASVIPAVGPAEVAIFVEGMDPDVSCISGYLNSSGLLTAFPIYLPPGPGGWDTVYAHGLEMPGGRTFSFRADCDSTSPGTSMSDAVMATLWNPGDVDNNSVVDILDAVRGVDGFVGRFLIVAADREPCLNDADCVERRPHQSCDLPSGLCLWITLENVDTIGDLDCEPNGDVSIRDILDTLRHFQAFPDNCNPRCP